MLLKAVAALSNLVVPLMIAVICIAGYAKKVRVYETFIEGAKDGFAIAIRLVPFLVGMFVAIGIFRESGALALLTRILSPLTQTIGMPSELLPLALIRPLSGTGALEVTVDLVRKFGPDSLIGRIASTMQASSETTIYIITVYFGAVGIRKTRHSLAAGLIADFAAFLSSVAIWRLILTFD
ncbi:MAG: spore maturation protein [Bacillota bacterium]|jgi:spore maturation protein B|nr:spore maturation protein [Bacillota bacterium]MDI9415014.1 spore maturation protein [Bacillota bacterium]NLD12739.1 spore maturation protein [Bacillota bacterium]HAV21853.1 spore maturation protein [Bacillota bacterium]HCD42070.1 spore maturation protein [Bacillota bacterium]